MARLASLPPVIDHPQEGERIVSPRYTIRVGAPASATRVEISIDQGLWIDCRPSAGYWWHDWSGYGPGEHELIARCRTADGEVATSPPRRFLVRLARTAAGRRMTAARAARSRGRAVALRRRR